MNVLYITHYNGMGGANRSLFQLIIELKENHNVHPFVLIKGKERENSLSDQLEKYEIPYMFMNTVCFKQRNLTLRKYLAYIKGVFRNVLIYRRIRHLQFDIVHTNSSIIATGVILKMFFRAKHVWHLREFGEEDFGMKPFFGKLYERIVYSQADVFISISKVIKTKYEKVIPLSKNEIIYNGILDIKNEYLSVHKNTFTQFVCIGWVNEYKNQIEILRAVDYLVNKCNINKFHVTIVGPCKPEYQVFLESFIQKHSLLPYITLIGETADVKPVLKQMDVGIVPSKAEAFGRVTIEYMMHNLAVIANDSGANPELVDNGVTGLLYHHDEYEHLAEAMITLIRDKDLLISMAANGRTKATRSFLSSTNSDLVCQLYKKCLYK